MIPINFQLTAGVSANAAGIRLIPMTAGTVLGSFIGVAVLTENVDIANVRLEFENGAVANLTASRVSQERVRKIREADRHHHFTLVCRDLSEIARYARVDNSPLIVDGHTTGVLGIARDGRDRRHFPSPANSDSPAGFLESTNGHLENVTFWVRCP